MDVHEVEREQLQSVVGENGSEVQPRNDLLRGDEPLTPLEQEQRESRPLRFCLVDLAEGNKVKVGDRKQAEGSSRLEERGTSLGG